MKPLRLGVVGLDGHGPVFISLVNGKQPAVPDARVTAAMPVPSVMITDAQLRKNVAQTKKYGVDIMDDPEALAARTDGILILHDDGSQHLNLVKMFAGRGKPVFVDKPLEASTVKARQIAGLCRRSRTPVLTASSLRFSREIIPFTSPAGKREILSCLTYSPYLLKPTMPGWLYYAVHAVEPLYALMGPGCATVRCLESPQGPVAVGIWKDGRTGIARATTKGPHAFGFAVWGKTSQTARSVNPDLIYGQLLRRIVRFFRTGKPPVPITESVEVIAFLEAANKSLAAGGRPIAVKS